MTISVLLLTAAFDRKRLTDDKTRVHVIIGYFVRKILSLDYSDVLATVWFSDSNCLVEVKVQARFKLYFGGSMHLS